MGFKRTLKLGLAAAAAASLAACEDLGRVADGMSRSVLDHIELMVTASRPVQMADEKPAARAMNVDNTEYSPIPPLLFAPGELIMKPVQNVSTASFAASDAAQVSETLSDIADRAIAQSGIAATPTKIDETSGQVVLTLDAALKAAAEDAAAGGSGVRPMAFTGIAGPDGADGAVITPQTVEMATERGNGCQNVSAKEMNENLGVATECAAAKLKASGKFEYVELNYIMRPEMEFNPIGAAVTLPNDPLFSLQWGFRDQGTKAGQIAGGAGFQSFWSRTRGVGRRSVVVAIVLNAGYAPWLACVAAVATGAACGVVSGVLVTRLRVAPFIVTLGMLLLVRGVAMGLAGEQKINAPITWLGDLLATLPPAQRWQVLPPGVWLVVVLAAATSAALRYTTIGRHLAAMGSSEGTARLCGVPVERRKLQVYTLSAALAGASGVLQFSRLTVGDPTVATGLELDVIAAVVIGGGSLSGGEGSVLGTIVGALIMTVIRSGSSQMGLPNWVQEIVTAVIIVFAVALDRWRHRTLSEART